MPFPPAGAGLPNDPRFSERCYASRWCAVIAAKDVALLESALERSDADIDALVVQRDILALALRDIASGLTNGQKARNETFQTIAQTALTKAGL